MLSTELQLRFTDWERKTAICLFEEMSQALCVSICKWAGVPLKENEVRHRAADFVAMVDAFGSIGMRNLRGRRARKRAEQWISGVVSATRSGRFEANKGTALDIVVGYKEPSGELLEKRMAAIELINILRPTVAIAWYIVFAAKAFYDHPEWRQRFATGAGNDQENFIDEIRRFYPFAPFMGARVRQNFNWRGYPFPKGALVLLDMYGTNHDARLWDSPLSFNPDRFKSRQIKPFDFLAQGGGDVSGHRCPGERVTIELLLAALRFLTQDVNYNIPKQDLSIDLSRMPALPKSRVKIADIRSVIHTDKQMSEPTF